MASRYGSIVKEAIVLLDKFRAGRQCLDDFIQDAVKDLQKMDAPQKKFILDVVSGCVEHKNLLDVVINAFYGQYGKSLSRGDQSQFDIICYIATNVLDDLGLLQFSNIVKSLDIRKMHKFLGFFFSNLTTWIQDEWNSLYDAAFVEEHWIGPLLRWRPEIEILLDQLAVKISQGSQVKKAPIKTTVHREFSLTKPKPRPLPLPELIPQQEKSKPVPKSTYRPPKEMQIIEKIKQKNRQKAEEHLYDANMKQLRCVNPQKSEHTKKAMAQIEEDFEAKLKFNLFRSSETPSSNKVNSCSIQLNNAAILRKEALCDRQLEKDLQRIEELAQGAHEPSSFLHWQEDLLERDNLEMLDKMKHRHYEGRISDEKVALIRHRIKEHNQRTAQLKKEETARLMQRYAEKRLKEENVLRELVQQVAAGHKNSKIAKEKLQNFKQSIVTEVSEQSQELLRQALEEAQEEMSRKIELIHKIRATESLPHIGGKNFDDTETAGHKLLGEMSLSELKERLALLRESHQAKKQEKQKHIMQEKQTKKQQLLENLDTIDLHRRALAQAAAIRKEKKKTKLELFQQAMAQDETLLALQKQLEEIRQERQRLKQTESSKPMPCKRTSAHTGSNQRSPKKKSWEEVEQSLARHVQDAL
ncbi:cilia- and flagella-associated protein 99 isoform X1 [Embiotoca jacksoni]|uniref:cilia- and flagella-associated protein 99 isoform X1 n=1 Tax=Embiotoca jacksoni TaxID=100190 RepID=UPI0037042347